jgi:hypothetical protein
MVQPLSRDGYTHLAFICANMLKSQIIYVMNKRRHEMANCMHQHDFVCHSSNTVVHAGTHRYTQLSLEML